MGRFGYTGQAWLPELGMFYYKARIYSPTLGRFLQVDPIGFADGQAIRADGEHIRLRPGETVDSEMVQCGAPPERADLVQWTNRHVYVGDVVGVANDQMFDGYVWLCDVTASQLVYR